MIKYLLLLFNVAGLLFFATFFETDPVTVAHNFPESVSTGSEYVVEIKINKNEVSGFAEFKQILPEGFTATAMDSKKGSFSFTDREVKIIWMTLPQDKEFIVKYKITVLSSAASEGWVDGTFSFLDNNQKTTVNLEKKKIFVNTTITNLDNPTSDTSKKSETLLPVQDAALNLPVGCSRKLIYNEKPNQILVEVELRNDSISGFAKLEELIPPGFIASANELHGAVFSFVDQKVKFLWMSFPFEKEFKVSYFLSVPERMDDSSQVSGYLSFTIAEESKKFTLTPSLISLPVAIPASSGRVVASEKAQPKKDSTAEITSLSTLATDLNKNEKTFIESSSENQETKVSPTFPEAMNQTEEKAKSTSPLGKAKEIKTIPEPQTGISFRVQICATHKPVELAYFRDTYKINDEIYAEMHEGWHKFTLNNVTAYQLARNKREELKQNEQIKGPFVTAYNSGSRITVQEALMIANQKWVR